MNSLYFLRRFLRRSDKQTVRASGVDADVETELEHFSEKPNDLSLISRMMQMSRRFYLTDLFRSRNHG